MSGWLRRYAADQGLADRSSRPHGCPHQMTAVVEARIVEVRRAHPGWGADRIGYQLTRDGVVSVPGRSSIYRALVRNGLVVPGQRKRRRVDYRRWERARPMELWQMDVVGGFHLADGTELKAISGIDDIFPVRGVGDAGGAGHREPVCDALLAALRRWGVPEQILTDNGKVFTGRFGPAGVQRGGVVRPDLRRERDPASADRAPVTDHHREGGAVAQDDARGVPP